MLNGPGSVKELAHASSLCGACADACPVRIDIPRMLIELRRQVDEKRIAPWIERVVFESFGWLLARPLLYGLAGRIARVLQRPFVRDGAIRSLPLFGDWTRTRDLPAVASRTFRERWNELERSEEHTSELQSQSNLVCRLLLEKKKQPEGPVLSGPPPTRLFYPAPLESDQCTEFIMASESGYCSTFLLSSPIVVFILDLFISI